MATATALQHLLKGIQGRDQKLGTHFELWENGLQIVRYFHVRIFLGPNSYIFPYLEKQ